MRHLLLAVFVVMLPLPAVAQWLDHRTPGIPRDPDGKPNLRAAAPRTADGRPDFTGLWRADAIVRDFRPGPDDVLPWARDLARQRAEEFFKTRPSYACKPSGPEPIGGLKRIVQTPTMIIILNEDLTYRQVFMDGRALESRAFPTWMGYSVGRWDGDTLVVDSIGFNDRTWLNNLGLPHTEALQVTERYQRQDFGSLRVDVTFTDPGAYTKPLTFTRKMDFAADTEMLEAVCEVGSDTWAGSVDEVKKSAVVLPHDTLAAYAGTYSGLYGGRTRTVEVRLVGDELFITGLITEQTALIPQSETLFTSAEGLSYKFDKDAQGAVTQVEEVHSSGNYPYRRQR